MAELTTEDVIGALQFALKTATGDSVKLERVLVEEAVQRLSDLKRHKPPAGMIAQHIWEDDS